MADMICGKCGARFGTEAALGLCPCCLLDTGVKLADASRSDAGLSGGGGTVAQQESAEALSSPFRLRLEDYELLEQIGQGGMGVVYKARQISLNRIVAVKMLLGGEFASQAAMLRFRIEAESAARLHHPNIVSIHEAGEHDGRPYFSMDFVEGRTLASVVRETPLTPLHAARYTQKVAAAVHYAHSKGILHRDLKPSNVIIDEADEPRVSDFGLAKQFGVQGTDQPIEPMRSFIAPAGGEDGAGDQTGMTHPLTLSGEVLGSPGFMPPEQASARWGSVGPRSDVYGLGALFYYLLTARAPFRAATVTDTLEQLVNSEPGSPRLLNSSVPVDLETICLKCLEKEPRRRYGSAREVADELGRFLRGEPIRARPLGPLGWTWRWCRRRPALASLGAAFALAAMLILVGSPIAVARIERERQRAEAEAFRNVQNLYAADLSLAYRALADNNLGIASRLVEQYMTGPSSVQQLRGWEWRYLWGQCRGDESLTIRGHTDGVPTLAFSPDGKLLVSGGWDARLQVFDLASRTVVTNIVCQSPVASIAFTPDGRQLLTGTWSDGLEILETQTWRKTRTVEAPEFVFSLALSPDGRKVALSGNAFATLWELTGTQEVTRVALGGASERDGAVAFSPDGHLLAYIGRGAVGLKLIGATGNDKEIKNDTCSCLSFCPNGDLLALGDLTGGVTVWTTAELRKVAGLAADTASVTGLAFSPDGRILATCGQGQNITLWSTEDWRTVGVLKGHTRTIWTVKFSADGKFLASADSYGSVKLWRCDAARSGNKATISYPDDLVPHLFRRAYPARYGRAFMLVRSNLTFEVFDKLSLRQTVAGRLPIDHLQAGTISPTADVLALATEEGLIHLLRAGDLREIGRLLSSGTNWSCVLGFSPDGNLFARANSARFVEIWDLRHPSKPLLLETSEGGTIQTLDFSADGKLIAAAHWAGGITLLHIPGRQTLAVLRGHRVGVRDARFSPDGKSIASAGGDGTVRLWNLGSLTEVAQFEVMGERATTVAFSIDGRMLAAGDTQGYIYFWRIDIGRNAGVVRPADRIEWLEFLADGDTLAYATSKGVSSLKAPSLP